MFGTQFEKTQVTMFGVTHDVVRPRTAEDAQELVEAASKLKKQGRVIDLLDFRSTGSKTAVRVRCNFRWA